MTNKVYAGLACCLPIRERTEDNNKRKGKLFFEMKHFIAYFNYPNQSIELDADSFEVSLDEGIVKFLDNNKDIISIVTIKDLLVVKKVSS